jgi:predicted O-methyltransferase YrrM
MANGAESDEYVERRLKLGPLSLRIWEETGESIARHIWDGGFALTAYLAQRVHIPTSMLSRGVHGSLSTLDALLDSETPINILELGSGCGTVGLGIATLHPQCNVTLSDLQLAEEIMQRNLDSSGLVERVRSVTLDWEKKVPSSLLEQAFDVVLVADCFYNAASAPHLVRVLMQLTENARNTIIVLAHKKRHDSEEVFFELLESFVTVNRADIEVGESYVNLYVLKRGSG